jgi:type IV pili sensor histidine kinase/response regulator
VAPTKVFPASPAPPVAVVSAARPVPAPPPPLPTWSAQVGSTLHQTVADWCKRAGVRLIWNQEDLDYPIEAPLNFKGTFPDVIAQIFPLYDGAKRSFVVDGNTSSQGILYVSERKK